MKEIDTNRKENIMKLKVLSKKEVIEKDGKKQTFYRYFTPVQIEVVENGESHGIQEKNLRVHFTKKASKKLDDEKVFAIFEIENPEDIQLPYQFKVIDYATATDDEKSVNDVWIRDFKEFKVIPYKGKQATCVPVIDDEEETEETTIE